MNFPFAGERSYLYHVVSMLLESCAQKHDAPCSCECKHEPVFLCWTASVLKVQTKTVAQCVEFYYTYKKQVKIGRNGILTFGPPDSPVEKHTEAVVDVKVVDSFLD